MYSSVAPSGARMGMAMTPRSSMGESSLFADRYSHALAAPEANITSTTAQRCRSVKRKVRV